jgi:hypothetical protein
MSDTDAARIELYEIAKQKVDERYAELLMKILPLDPDRSATKDDVQVLGADVRTAMADLGANLRTEMADLGANLRTEMADLRTEMRTEMADVRTEMRTGFADVRTEIADLRTEVGAEIHGAVGAQTRTMVFSLVGSVTALAIANVVALGFVS